MRIIADRGRSVAVLAALSLLLFLVTAATYSALGIVLPDMVREMHWSWSEAGFGYTLLGVCCGASAWLPRILIRRFGVQAALLAGAAVMAGGLLALGLCHGLALYFLATAACGIAYQMVALIPGSHVIAGLFHNRSRAIGFYFAAASVGSVAGPGIVFALMRWADWRQFWFIQAGLAAAIGAACAVIVGRLTQNSPVAPAVPRTEETGWTVREVLRTPQFYILLAAYFAHLLSGVSVASISVAHLTERGVALGVAGAMLSLEAFAGLGGRLGAGILGDRVPAKYLLLFALTVNCIGCFALADAGSLASLLIYALGTGLGFGLTAVAVAVLLLDYYGRKNNLEIFALTCLIGALSALGPFIAGEIRDHTGGFAAAFQLYGALIGLIAIAALFMRRPVRGPRGTI